MRLAQYSARRLLLKVLVLHDIVTQGRLRDLLDLLLALSLGVESVPEGAKLVFQVKVPLSF